MRYFFLVTASRSTFRRKIFLRNLALFQLLLFAFVFIFSAIKFCLLLTAFHALLLLHIKITSLSPAMDPTENTARSEIYFILFSEYVADTVD
jgi:hypothetical protein